MFLVGGFGEDEALEGALEGGFVEIEGAEVVLAAGVSGSAAGLEGAHDFLGAGEVDVFEGVGGYGGDVDPVCDVGGVFADGFAVAAVGLVVGKLMGEEAEGEWFEFGVGPVEWVLEWVPGLDFGEECLEWVLGGHGE